MKAPAPADLQRWSEEVARDPASLAFLPLARAYRKQGRRDAALKLCLRGLEQHPTHVDAHAMLAMLYFESGQRSKAYDEWSMVLRLEPDNFEALRGMGFYHLEQGDDFSALRSLQRAGGLKQTDLAVQEAIKMIRERQQGAAIGAAPAEKDPWEAMDELLAPATPAAPSAPAAPVTLASSSPVGAAAAPPAAVGAPAAAVGAGAAVEAAQRPWPTAPALQPSITTAPNFATPARATSAAPAPAAAPTAAPAPTAAISAGELPDDPSQLFSSLQKGGQIIGALILDSQGLVLAGSLTGEQSAKSELLGAILGGAIEEAVRTAAHLSLGQWNGILLEAEQALLHLAPIREGMIVLVAAKRQTPAGFMLRAASQAASLATRFLEVYA